MTTTGNRSLHVHRMPVILAYLTLPYLNVIGIFEKALRPGGSRSHHSRHVSYATVFNLSVGTYLHKGGGLRIYPGRFVSIF